MKTAEKVFYEALQNIPSDRGAREKELKRFWAKVRREENEGSCWEWTAAKMGDGYGTFTLIVGGGKKSFLAHRLMFEYAHDMIVWPGFCVLHSCDNRSCVNPQHLFLGTNQDNVNDKVIKGRQWCPIGTLAPWAKLTEEDVLEIRRLWENRTRTRGTVSYLAARFGVSCSNISRITHRRGWNHI